MQYNFISFIFGHKSLFLRMLGMSPLVTSDKESKKRNSKLVFLSSDSASRTRTYDIMINSHALLPTELWRIK